MFRLLRRLSKEFRLILSIVTSFKLPRKASDVFSENSKWLDRYSNSPGGVQVSSLDERNYPEVTGYLIPSLLQWGKIELASNYLEFLLKAQSPKGSFPDPTGNVPCVFDTGQAIRGLIPSMHQPDVMESLLSALGWIASLIDSDGKIELPEEEIWGHEIPRGITLYALQPAYSAAKILNDKLLMSTFRNAINRILEDKDLIKLNSLNHFHAYIIEALVDLGFKDLAMNGMAEISKIQKKNGKIPAYKHRSWSCSTGQFQYATIYFKLGDFKRGQLALEYGCKKQNKSGGWYGTLSRRRSILYPLRVFSRRFLYYFPNAEIPWANKFFMDALYLRQEMAFEDSASLFQERISPTDGRANLLVDQIRSAEAHKILDMGCGKGRFAKLLSECFPYHQISVMDFSSEVMSGIVPKFPKYLGMLSHTSIPDGEFDFLYAIESLEHEMNYSGAIREFHRLLKPNGRVLIIDKNRFHRGSFRLDFWEKWFSLRKLSKDLQANGFRVEKFKRVSHEGKGSRLFFGCLGIKE